MSSELLQSQELDMLQASKCLKSATEQLEKYRNNYDLCKAEAEELAHKWNINTNFDEKRQHKPKPFFNENRTTHMFSGREYYFKVNVYIALLDTVINQINTRFQNFHSIINAFQFLCPSIFVSLSEDVLIKNAEMLQKIYSKDISENFLIQIVSLLPLKYEIQKCKNILEFGNFLVKNHTFSSNFPDVFTAITLFLTLPVTVASAERAFSRLKIIKNQLRCTMSEERLSSLALLAIEAEQATSMDKEHFIGAFVEAKKRRKDFS